VIRKSGSGKTHTLNLITGSTPGRRHIILYDQRVAEEKKRIPAHDLPLAKTLIFQFLTLIPTLTVWENDILPRKLKQLLNEASIDCRTGFWRSWPGKR
jgi:ABC-type lipoprotein export system ATPase subunit